jgi:prepilin-type N-terminal cleavage/methylation domain-containing protein
MQTCHRNRGFTLLELLIALVISLFLIGGAILMYLSGSATTREARELSRIQENLRFASDFIIRDIRNAGYRDRAGLVVVAADEIDRAFADIEIDDNGRQSLNIRYAGRGSCSQTFEDDTFSIVQNTYTVANGNLTCNGITLISGVNDVQFEFIFPAGVDPAAGECNTADLDALRNSCIGVRINLAFEGLRDFGTGTRATNEVQLVAAFRNVILSRMNFLNDLSI